MFVFIESRQFLTPDRRIFKIQYLGFHIKMSSQHRKQSTSLNFGRYFVVKVSIRFKGEVPLENHNAILMDLSIKEFGPKTSIC